MVSASRLYPGLLHVPVEIPWFLTICKGPIIDRHLLFPHHCESRPRLVMTRQVPGTSHIFQPNPDGLVHGPSADMMIMILSSANSSLSCIAYRTHCMEGTWCQLMGNMFNLSLQRTTSSKVTYLTSPSLMEVSHHVYVERSQAQSPRLSRCWTPFA